MASRTSLVSRTLGRIGRTLIAAGVLVFLFLGYLLWGTNLQTSASQDKLEHQYDRQVAEAQRKLATTTSSPAPAPPSTDVRTEPVDIPLAAPAPGGIVGRISIPKIGLTPKVIVEGVDEEQLKRGPGHYPGTRLPGQKGNAAIAGHRTTYGSPFHDVDQLTNGDQIKVDTTYGSFLYTVTDKKIVSPDDTSVLQDHGEPVLTLTACHPKWSAEQRIIIIAKLQGQPVGKLAGQDEADRKVAKVLPGAQGERRTALNSLDSPHPSKRPMVLWGLACAAIWFAAWVLARFVLGKRFRPVVRWLPYAFGLPLFLASLYVFFEHFVRQLPSSF